MGGGHPPEQWQACGPGLKAHGAGVPELQGYGQLAGLQYVPKGPHLWVLKYQHLAGGRRGGAWVAEETVWKPGGGVGVLGQHLQWLPLAWRK